MSARVIPQACITLPHWDKTLDAAGIVSHVQISRLLRESIDELVRAIQCEQQSPV